jgi:hypothetical protein
MATLRALLGDEHDRSRKRGWPREEQGQARPSARSAVHVADHLADDTLPDGRVLRSGDRPGVEQELWALLTLYQCCAWRW